MPTAVRLMLLGALALFAACLPMQALRTYFMHQHVVLDSWQATALALNVLGEMPKEAGLIVIALASMANLGFFAFSALACWRPRVLRAHAAHALLAASIGGTLAVWAPWSLHSMYFELLPGYFVWIAAHVLQILALLLLSVQERRTEMAAA